MNKNKLTTGETEQLLTSFFASGKFTFIEEKQEMIMLSDFLLRKINEKHLDINTTARKMAISYEIFEQILNSIIKPNRDQLLQIAIAMKLSIVETQVILKMVRAGALYKQNLRDKAIAYSIQNKFSLSKTQYYLRNQSLTCIAG